MPPIQTTASLSAATVSVATFGRLPAANVVRNRAIPPGSGVSSTQIQCGAASAAASPAGGAAGSRTKGAASMAGSIRPAGRGRSQCTATADGSVRGNRSQWVGA